MRRLGMDDIVKALCDADADPVKYFNRQGITAYDCEAFHIPLVLYTLHTVRPITKRHSEDSHFISGDAL